MIVVVVILEVFFYVLLFFALWFSDSHCKLCTCFLANGHCTCWLIISPARMTMTRSKNLKKRNKNWLYRMLNTLCQKKVIKSKPLDCKLSLVWLAFTHLFMHSILCKTSERNRQEIYSCLNIWATIWVTFIMLGQRVKICWIFKARGKNLVSEA